MILGDKLAQRLLEDHPGDAATELESLPADVVAQALAAASTAVTARVLQQMSPHRATPVLEQLPEADLVAVLTAMPTDAAASLLRRGKKPFRNQVLESVGGRAGRTLRTVLSYSTNSAAARMDPHVLTLPADLSVEQAVVQVREVAEHVLFNLYIVDRDNVLVGVLNLRELLTADPQKLLQDVMQKPSLRIAADADRRAILEHPGWRQVHSLPVVDAKGRFLGALRYRMLQRLQNAQSRIAGDRSTANALGELFRAGAEGALTALTSGQQHGRHNETPHGK
jgi:magnesium transporter